MRKLTGLVLALMFLLTLATPVHAAECVVTPKIWRRRVRIRIICNNPTEPVNIDETVTSEDGRSTARVRIFIRGGGSSSVSITSQASTSTNNSN